MYPKPLAIAALLTLITLIGGCGGSEEEMVRVSSPELSEAIPASIDSTLISSSVISADITAEYGVFLVDDIDASSTGLLAILDGVNATVTVIDSEGIVTTAGGSGSGPGEFQWPIAVSISSEGFVAVSDYMAGIVRIYQPGLQLYTDIDGFIMANPGVMYITGEDSFTAMRVHFTAEEGETFIGHQAALWSGTNSEPSHVYTESMTIFDMNDFGSSIVAPYPMTTNSQGVVFLADVSTEKYVLTSYSAEGEVIWAIERPFDRVEKTLEEIEFEEDMVTRRLQQSAHQVDYTADPFQFAVTTLALDSSGRLWAERPGYGTTLFNVFNSATGEYLFSATAEDSYERLEITPGGIFAVTLEEPQMLLELELAASDNLD